MGLRPSTLETQLKQIANAHPQVKVHPNSPSGPHVRAVLWTAHPGLLGQALWEPDHQRWMVRAFVLALGQEESLVVEHPETADGISEAITRVIDRVRKEHTRWH